jgi:hypothetical protein
MERRGSDKIFMQFCNNFYKAAKKRNSSSASVTLNTEESKADLNSIKNDPYAPRDALYLLREDILETSSPNINKILKVYKLRNGGEEEVEIEEW